MSKFPGCICGYWSPSPGTCVLYVSAAPAGTEMVCVCARACVCMCYFGIYKLRERRGGGAGPC
jgi:hypothetical protein